MFKQINVDGVPYTVFGDGPYQLHDLNDGFFYISNNTHLNCVSISFSGSIRSIFDRATADGIMTQIQPTEQLPEQEE